MNKIIKFIIIISTSIGAYQVQAQDVIDDGSFTKTIENNSDVVSSDNKAHTQIPVVPKAVLNNLPKQIPLTARANNSTNIRHANKNSNSPITITVEPGVTQILDIATVHANRIITPYPSPKVISTTLTVNSDGSCAEVCIKDNVIYVATNKTTPVSMFIINDDNQKEAIALTLLPKRIPPTEITLKIKSKPFIKHMVYFG